MKSKTRKKQIKIKEINIMKNLRRIVTLIVVMACIFSCFSAECFAYNGETYKRSNAYVNSVTLTVDNHGALEKKNFLGKVTGTTGTELALTNTDSRSSSFKYKLVISGKTVCSGTVNNGKTTYIILPKGSEGKPIQLIFDNSTNFTINYSIKVSGDIGIWQSAKNSVLG